MRYLILQKMNTNAIRRPTSLSKDNSSSESAIIHIIKSLDFKVDNIIFLQATSPLRKPNDIDLAFKTFIESRSDPNLCFHVMKLKIILMSGH